MRKNPGERSRLWDVEDIEEVMFNNTGTMAVEAIWSPSHDYKQQWFIKEAMKNMQRLRLLCIRCYLKESVDSEESDDSKENDDSIDYLPNNLRWFVWHDYPWKLLPQNFNPIKLVHLELLQSWLRRLWNETKQQLPFLWWLYLSISKSLKRTPDWSDDLEESDDSEENDDSIDYLPNHLRWFVWHDYPWKLFPQNFNPTKLVYLNLSGSQSLQRTPNFTGMPNLEYLDLNCCTSLEKVHHSL